jgi:hypothetical protein
MSDGEFRRTSVDALRSVAKYLAFALGDEWEVRFSGEEYEFRLPFCLVAWAGQSVYEGSREFPTVTRPMQIDCYPAHVDTVEAARLQAEEVEGLLFDAFRVGRGLGRPERIPFYDYAGVGLGQGTSEKRLPNDFLRIVPGSLQIEPLADPTDDRWIRIVASMRLSWRRVGRQIRGKPVESLSIQFGS